MSAFAGIKGKIQERKPIHTLPLVCLCMQRYYNLFNCKI